MSDVKLYLGDCLEILPTLEAGSVDAVITDPPYPHIKRDYGYWTTEEWWALIVEGVIPQVRRVLKPTGSAVFILQPNSEKVGKMRGWLWEFMAWVCREWNMVQDVWWWKLEGLPWVGASKYGLMRQSVKSCIWVGDPECYRDQSSILIAPAKSTRNRLIREHNEGKLLKDRLYSPSGHSVNRKQVYRSMMEKGGVTPYNLLIPKNNYAQRSPGANGHGAGTPLNLADWWTRYIVPPGGVVLDPFFGVGTMGLAALQNGCDCIGIEIDPDYYAIAEKRIKKAQSEAQQLELRM
jgi:DNA modification methylase